MLIKYSIGIEEFEMKSKFFGMPISKHALNSKSFHPNKSGLFEGGLFFLKEGGGG